MDGSGTFSEEGFGTDPFSASPFYNVKPSSMQFSETQVMELLKQKRINAS